MRKYDLNFNFWDILKLFLKNDFFDVVGKEKDTERNIT